MGAYSKANFVLSNDMVLIVKGCASPAQVVFTAVTQIAQWKFLLPAKRQEATMTMIKKIQDGLYGMVARGIG